jgi:hypothetical protein
MRRNQGGKDETMLNVLSWIVAICLWSSGAFAAETIRAAYEDKSLPPYYTGTSEVIDPVAPGVSVEVMPPRPPALKSSSSGCRGCAASSRCSAARWT